MKKAVRALIAAMILLLVAGQVFAGGQSDSGEKQMVVKAAHSMPTSYHYHDGMVKFAEETEKRTNGKIKVEVYPAAQLGEERVTMEQLKLGAIPIVLTGISDAYAPRTGVFYLPFLFKDSEHADRVLNGPVGMEVFKDLEKEHNMVTLSIWENGFRQISNNKRPINTVADMQGLKLRTPEAPVYMETAKSFGASPTPMPFAETATALIQGLVDGQENALLHILANKTYEVQKHIAVVNYMYGLAPLLTNKQWLEALPQDEQKALRDAAAVANTHMRAVAKTRDGEAIKQFEAAGLTITRPDTSSFRAKVEPLYDTIFAQMYGKDLLDKIRAAQ